MAETVDIIAKVLGVVGGILGAVAFGWKVWDAFQSYLYLDLAVEKPEAGFALAKTTVENKSLSAKRIDYAILLVGPESESPIDTFNSLAPALKKDPIRETNDLEDREVDAYLGDSAGRAIVPLPFYYSENVDIADEKVSYTYPLKVASFQRDVPYAVRFFIFGQRRLHRSTQAVVLFPKDDQD